MPHVGSALHPQADFGFPKCSRRGCVPVCRGVHSTGRIVSLLKLMRKLGAYHCVQDSLGGNSKTTIIATVSPSSWLVPMYPVVDSSMALHLVDGQGHGRPPVFRRAMIIISRDFSRFRVWQQYSGNLEHSEVRPTREAHPQHGRPLSVLTCSWTVVVSCHSPRVLSHRVFGLRLTCAV